MPSYVYDPLRKGHIRRKQCIRLVKLLPGPHNDKIRIKISRASVEERSYPVYEALSYCWGDESNPREIEVVSRGTITCLKPQNGLNYITLKVTANLASALIHLRRQDTERVLWIDAICLDQRNNSEKSLELGKMGDIYARAKNVVIWLGPASSKSVKAFRAMSQLGRQVQWVAEKNELISAKDCDEAWEHWKSESFVVPFDHETWLAIEEVISSSWFRRVWIWQEICLANHDSTIVQCGESFMPWKRFLNAIAFFETDPESGAIGYRERFKTALKPVANLTLIPRTRHLLGLLGVTRRCGCKEPKDRIYGLLGLATQADEGKLIACLKPDYDKPSSQVYKDFAAGEIKIMRRLSILWHCDAMGWGDELPSWVPDWNKPLPYRNLNLGTFGGGRGALGLKDSFGSISNDILKVNGVVCDTVRSCSATAPESVAVSDITSILRTWCRGANFSSNKLSTDKQTLVALCHAMTAGYIRNRYPEEFRPASLQATKDIIKYILTSTRAIKSSSDIPLPDESFMLYHMSNVLPDRKFFLTETGRIGLGPSQAQPGDKVISIIGSKKLMLLRAVPSHGGSFVIVGVCYLHGFMDLEAILGPLPEGYSVQLVGSCNDPWDMRFVRDGESELSPQDPRLEMTYEGWNSDRREERDGAIIWDHIDSRIATRSDPRHTDVEFLKRRGVTIKQICII